MRDMTPAVNSAYTGLLTDNLMMRGELKAQRDAEAAEEARKKPRPGMTVAHLGTHLFSTGPVLVEGVRRAAASKAAKDKGKGKAVVLSILADSQPAGEPAD